MTPLRWVGVAALAMLLLTCIGLEILPLTLGTLLVGWAGYLYRTLPKVHVNPSGVGMAVLCLANVAALGHVTAAWLYASTAPPGSPPRRWKPRWTASALGVVVLMFVCGIAATGVVHQTGWLINSPVPLTQSSHPHASARVVCASNLRQIGQLLLLYSNDDRGRRFPPDLATAVRSPLFADEVVASHIFCCPATQAPPAPGIRPADWADLLNDRRHNSYIYLGAGLTNAVGAETVLVVEYLDNHPGGGGNVLYGDGHVDWLNERDAAELLLKLGVLRPVPQR